MNEFLKKHGGLILIILLIFGVGFYLEYQRNQKLSMDQKYGVGRITERHYHEKGSASIEYKYVFNGLQYSVSSYERSRRVKVGERYIISLPRGYEDEGIILFDYPVPEGVKSPSQGWDQIPDFSKTE